MPSKWLILLLGGGALVALLSFTRTPQTVGIDFNDSFRAITPGSTGDQTVELSSASSSSSSYSSNGEYSASATLTKGAHASLGQGRDTITLEILKADLQPLTYDGTGEVTLRVGLNGRVRTETLAVPARLNPATQGVYDTLEVGAYTLSLVSYSGDFANPSFTFELQ